MHTTPGAPASQQLWVARALASRADGLFTDGKAANDAGDVEGARKLFEHAFLALPRVAYLLSVANMHLKAEAPDVARAFYLRVLQTPHSLPTPPPTEAEAQMARRKLDEATRAAAAASARCASSRGGRGGAADGAAADGADGWGVEASVLADEVEARGDAAAAEAAEAAAAAAAARMVAEELAPRLSVGGGGDVVAGAEEAAAAPEAAAAAIGLLEAASSFILADGDGAAGARRAAGGAGGGVGGGGGGGRRVGR